MCMNDLSGAATRQCGGRESNCDTLITCPVSNHSATEPHYHNIHYNCCCCCCYNNYYYYCHYHCHYYKQGSTVLPNKIHCGSVVEISTDWMTFYTHNLALWMPLAMERQNWSHKCHWYKPTKKTDASHSVSDRYTPTWLDWSHSVSS